MRQLTKSDEKLVIILISFSVWQNLIRYLHPKFASLLRRKLILYVSDRIA